MDHVGMGVNTGLGVLLMCVRCGWSYDRANAKDNTIAACILWAVKRTKRFRS